MTYFKSDHFNGGGSLPTRFPVDTNYVLEGRGPFVRRYVEFLNGRRIPLTTRKAVSCTCLELQQIGIVPDENSAGVYASSRRKRVVA